MQKSYSVTLCLTYVLLPDQNFFVKVVPYSKLISAYLARHMKEMLEVSRTSGREIVYVSHWDWWEKRCFFCHKFGSSHWAFMRRQHNRGYL